MYRITFGFGAPADDRAAGWRESYWLNPGSDSGAIAAIKKLVQVRIPLLGIGANLTSASLRNLANPRRGVLVPVAELGVKLGSRGSADFPTTKLSLVQVGPDGVRVQQWIGGFGEAVVGPNNTYAPGNLPGFTIRMNAFTNFLAAAGNPFVLRVLDPTNPPRDVMTFDAATGTFTYAGAALGGVGNIVKVRIGRIVSPRAANGVVRVVVLPGPAQAAQIKGWVASTAVVDVGQSAYVRPLTYIPVQQTDVFINRVTRHAVGRPTNPLSGRRTKR